MGRREQKKLETRRTLLAKAHELFAAKGYQTVTTAEIARAAGIGEGTLFNYFNTKGDLFVASMMPEASNGSPSNAVLDETSPAELALAVVAVIDRELSQLAHVRKPILQNYFAVVYGGGLSEGLQARKGLFAADERMLKQVADLLHSQKAAHPTRLEKLDADMAAACIFSCVTSLFSQYVLLEQIEYEEFRRAMQDQIRFLLTGHVS